MAAFAAITTILFVFVCPADSNLGSTICVDGSTNGQRDSIDCDVSDVLAESEMQHANDFRTSLLQSRAGAGRRSLGIDVKASRVAIKPITIEQSGGEAKVLIGQKPIGTDGKLRGVSGSGYPDITNKVGGNAVRTWDYGQWYWAFKNAGSHDLKVSAGIGITRDRKYYTDPKYCNFTSTDDYWTSTLQTILNQVNEYKDNSALLWWTVGNELEEQVSWADGNECLWRRVEWFSSKIKKADPNHPVGTVLANIAQGKVRSIKKLCPSLEFLGVNVYGNDAHALGNRLRSMGWTMPYALMEYGVPGWWSVAKTSWGARLETMTSTLKSPFFVRTYTECSEDKQCIGSWAFLWGWKWEKTATWFGLFDEWKAAGGNGYPLDTVFELARAWKPNSNPTEPPVTIETVKVLAGGRQSVPSIGFSAAVGAIVQVDVTTTGTASDVEVSWAVTVEDGSTTSGNVHQISFDLVSGIVQPCGKSAHRVLVDTSKLAARGSYRLYAFARARSGHGSMSEASASIPFFLGKQPTCHTTRPGDQCYQEAMRAKESCKHQGACSWPADSLLPSSTLEEFQAALNKNNRGNCAVPCSLVVSIDESVSCDGAHVPPPSPIPGPEECGDAELDSKCSEAIDWAMQIGIKQHPDWYDGLSVESSFAEFQRDMHEKNLNDCPLPCEFTTTTTTTTSMSEASCANYGCVGFMASHHCQCNSACKQHGSCCSDYDDKCAKSPTPSPATATSTATLKPKSADCGVAEDGSKCFGSVEWAMRIGIKQHPDWYDGLSVESSFADFQLDMHNKNLNDCPLPCEFTTTTTTTTTSMSEASCANYGCVGFMASHLCQCNSACKQHGSCCSDYDDTCAKSPTPSPAIATSVPTLKPRAADCGVAEDGSKCFGSVEWAMKTGIKQHPDWYDGLSEESSFADFQLDMHNKNLNECPLPCEFTTSTTTTTSMSEASCANYGCVGFMVSHLCQCNSACKQHGSCCIDYEDLCVMAPSPSPTPVPAPETSCANYGCVEFRAANRCQCNSACMKYGSCCSDYQEVCVPTTTSVPEASCANYGCVDFSVSHLCQCNSVCEEHGSCCSDYQEVCVPTTRSLPEASCANYGCVDFSVSHLCQCNPVCEKHGSCCSDYQEVCVAAAA